MYDEPVIESPADIDRQAREQAVSGDERFHNWLMARPDFVDLQDAYAEWVVRGYYIRVGMMSDQQQFQQANEERLFTLEEAIREALTKGVSMKSIKVLCYESGASHLRVVGEPTGE